MQTKLQQIDADLRAWDAIADHRSGSEGDDATSHWLCEQAGLLGVEAERHSFEFTRRLPGKAEVSAGDQRIQGLPCLDGPLQDDQPITGAAGPLGSGSIIGVCEFSPGGSAALEAARASGNHLAIVAIAAAQNILPGLAVQNAEAYRTPFGPPVLQVSSQAGSWLHMAASSGSVINVQAQLTAEVSEAGNVQATVSGTDQNLSPLVIMTPKSAWWTCTAERGGGICAWLACLRHFAIHAPKRDVIFTANTGHELSHLGLDHFTEQQPQLLTHASAWLHLGANFAARDSQLLWQASDPAWLSRGRQRLEALPDTRVRTTPIGQRPLGEARNIYDARGSFVSLLGNNRWFHHPQDRLANSVDLERTARLCDFVVEVADELANG